MSPNPVPHRSAREHREQTGQIRLLTEADRAASRARVAAVLAEVRRVACAVACANA